MAEQAELPQVPTEALVPVCEPLVPACEPPEQVLPGCLVALAPCLEPLVLAEQVVPERLELPVRSRPALAVAVFGLWEALAARRTEPHRLSAEF